MQFRTLEEGSEEPLSLLRQLERFLPLLTGQSPPIYLVGGVVRDLLLGHVAFRDFDFVVSRGAIKLAFRIANSLKLPAYVLDQERDIARIVLKRSGVTLDFAGFRGADLEADLRDRDFTINAMALPAGTTDRARLVDPCNGLADLAKGLIRQTHKDAIADDPVRTIRALRMAVGLDFTLAPDTERAILRSAADLSTISDERIRDELLKLLSTDAPHHAVSLMSRLGLLEVILPEIGLLADVKQSPPHHEPVLAHTESVLRWLTQIEKIMDQRETLVEPPWVDLQTLLSPYLDWFAPHLNRDYDGSLSGRLLLRLGALFHDVGKSECQTLGVDGRIRFLRHESVGAEMAARRLRQLCLSGKAVIHVQQIVAHHMRPLHLAAGDSAAESKARPISRRAIFRFFRDTGAAGVDVCLISLADHLATHDGPGDETGWHRLLQIVGQLLHHYYERHEETIAPAPLLNGRELMETLKIEPGPEVGRLLRLLVESQAAGEIASRDEAIQLARRSCG